MLCAWMKQNKFSVQVMLKYPKSGLKWWESNSLNDVNSIVLFICWPLIPPLYTWFKFRCRIYRSLKMLANIVSLLQNLYAVLIAWLFLLVLVLCVLMIVNCNIIGYSRSAMQDGIYSFYNIQSLLKTVNQLIGLTLWHNSNFIQILVDKKFNVELSFNIL